LPRSKFNEPPITGNSVLDEYLLGLHQHVYGLGSDITGGLDDDNLSEDFPNLTEDEEVTGEWTFTTHPLGLDHTLIANIGVNTHAGIDTHIADSLIHFLEASIDHANILNIGTNTHDQVDTHIADLTVHFTESALLSDIVCFEDTVVSHEDSVVYV